MKIEISKPNLQKFLVKHIIVLFLGYDFIVKILVSQGIANLSLFRYIIVYKALLVTSIVVLLKPKRNTYFFLKLAVLLTIAFAVSQFTLRNELNRPNILFNGYYYLNSALPLIFYCKLFKNLKWPTVHYQMQSFLIFMTINSIAIFIGYFFNIHLFKSYVLGGARFGFQGLLMYHSEAGYLYFIAIVLAYYFFKKEKKLQTALILILLITSSLIVGTKKASFLTMIFIIYFIIDNLKLITFKILLFGTTSMAIIAFVLKGIINDIYINQVTRFKNIYNEEGFLSSFTSHRNVLLQNNFMPYINEKWSAINYLFGGPMFSTNRIELELFDLILFFGVFGLIVYAWLLIHAFLKTNFYSKFVIFSLIFASLFSGNLFSSINVMIFTFLVIFYINFKENNSCNEDSLRTSIF